jgi:rhamnulose-1-phosphate aldolase
MDQSTLDAIRIVKEDIVRIAAHLTGMGWAEANAGNISVLMPPGLDDIWDGETETDSLPEPIPALAGRTFLVTAAGSRFRRLFMDMDLDILPVKVSSDACRVITLRGARRPTSEFSSHLHVLAAALERGWKGASLVHTHSTSMLALSSSDLPGEMLEDAVNRAHPEVERLLFRGVRFLDYHTPGTWELGRLTAEAFAKSDCVVWRKHGILGLGQDIDSACDAVEVIEKAARILLLEKSAFGKFLGLKDRELMIAGEMPREFPSDEEGGEDAPPYAVSDRSEGNV